MITLGCGVIYQTLWFAKSLSRGSSHPWFVTSGFRGVEVSAPTCTVSRFGDSYEIRVQAFRLGGFISAWYPELVDGIKYIFCSLCFISYVRDLAISVSRLCPFLLLSRKFLLVFFRIEPCVCQFCSAIFNSFSWFLLGCYVVGCRGVRFVFQPCLELSKLFSSLRTKKNVYIYPALLPYS